MMQELFTVFAVVVAIPTRQGIYLYPIEINTHMYTQMNTADTGELGIQLWVLSWEYLTSPIPPSFINWTPSIKRNFPSSAIWLS